MTERTNMSDKEVGAFMSGLQSQLVEALKQDKQVRINGLGTFRLQPVAARKSVDVSTGEEITIEGYNKIIFAPEAGLRELVEKVAEVSSAPKEIDPIQKLGAQAEEIKDILGELGQPVVPVEEPEEEEPETTETTQATQTTQTTKTTPPSCLLRRSQLLSLPRRQNISTACWLLRTHASRRGSSPIWNVFSRN